MKVIAIFGEPGSGKSTLMKRLLDEVGISREVKTDVKLVPYHNKDNIYVLGKYEEGEVFGGTDKMSMAVQPEAVKFLASRAPNDIVLFEGDRLCTGSFLEECVDKYDTCIVYLQTTKETRNVRYAERGSNQDETWLKGRESKINNIRSNFVLQMEMTEFLNESFDDQQKIIDFIKKMLYTD
jgi:uridine kinase